MAAPVVKVYPLSNYTYETKEPKFGKDASVISRMARMRTNFLKEGRRISVDGILLAQQHNTPHVLILELMPTRNYKLPGGVLKPGENAIEGLKRKLSSKLAPKSPLFLPDWEIGECVSTWWRPQNYDPNPIMYPYCPPHITKPKECKKIYIVHLSEREYFGVPKNMRLKAVPLFQLYDNTERYGNILSSIPETISRFQLNMIRNET